ncbi:DNA cytosine methyltransferase [Blautia obeum]|jgi:DNA (cytosine-5)-methyltransferase 1|uniref:DNA cytosine methyltransferase n=1 Tax=Blautia obeum TaxID=40520 RepID=UPI00356717D8
MENKQLTLGSLFDGSGGFPLGGLLTGQITPVWSSEIEPFAIRVTTKRLPQVKHYGDVSAISGADLPPVDIITFGSPCQDMSIAGKRDGLDGSRSSLFYEAIRIVKEMRCKTNGEKPRFIVWENVPGAFSSNKGQDFKAVLEAVISVKEPSASVPAPEKKGWPDADYYVGDGWSVAYRVFDAQWWGVPQRRKRIYLVADFADQSAPEILFNSEGLSRYSAEGFRAWQRAAAGAEGCTGEAGCNGAGGRICLNDQGGTQMDVSEDVTGTLRAQEHGHQPCVLEAAGFCTEHSADARSIGYEEERSPTLRAGVVPAAIALENHPADSRVKISEDGKVQTLTSRCGTGGGNVPMVMDAVENSVESPVKEVENSPTVTLKIRSGCEGGGKGAIWQEEKSATLGCNNDQTLFVPKCYGVCSKASHSMMSDNPHSGFYEAETSRTLDRSGGDPTCNQGGICVVEPVAFTQNQRDEVRDLGEKSAALAAEPGMKQQTFVLQGNMIGRKDENGPQGDGVNEDVCFTLDATDRHAVCAPEDVYAMTTGSYMQVAKEVAPTLMARDYKDPTTIAPAPHLNEGVMGTVATGAHPSGFNGQDAFNDRLVIDNPEAQLTPVTYTVRRLTPTECARLQGFPDWWCRDLGTENPTEEELAFWADVFETHRKIVTHAKKPKTEKQIRKWLADPYTDSAEYRIWGNGICLANAFFVLAGIAWCAGLEE